MPNHAQDDPITPPEKPPKKPIRKPAVLIADDPTHPKHEQANVIRTIGQRMREARELYNMSQVMAARRLGYSNPSKLSKIESASDTNSVPLWVIARAAKLYEVSIDFLMGASSDWEPKRSRSDETVELGWMAAAMESITRREMLVLRSLHDRLEQLDRLLPGLHACALEVDRTLARVKELNPAAYEDLRAGTAHEFAVEKMLELAGAAQQAHRDFKAHTRVMRQANDGTLDVGDSL